MAGRWGWAAAAVLMCGGAAGAAADTPGNAQAGEALAHQWCSGCHATEASSAAADTAPPWRQIAADPAKDEAYLTGFLSAPHGAMPSIALSRQEIADLVAYILSLGFE